MQIRPLTLDHADAAARLWEQGGLTRPWNDPRADFRTAVQGPASEVLGALASDTLLGTVMVGHEGHRGWLYYLAVDAERRGAGVGRALVAAAERWIEDQRALAPAEDEAVRGRQRERLRARYERAAIEITTAVAELQSAVVEALAEVGEAWARLDD